MLYGFLLDRLSLSIKNNWHDENGNVYLIFTRKEVQDKFIHWVCNKFSVSSEEEFIRDFQIENDIYLDPEKQIEYEEELEYE